MTIRTALSSQEEQWIIACYRFFEHYGFCDWYTVNKNEALKFIMKTGNGHLNPTFIQTKLDLLYNSVGIK